MGANKVSEFNCVVVILFFKLSKIGYEQMCKQTILINQVCITDNCGSGYFGDNDISSSWIYWTS